MKINLGLPLEYQQMPEYFDAHNVSEETNAKVRIPTLMVATPIHPARFISSSNINKLTTATISGGNPRTLRGPIMYIMENNTLSRRKRKKR
jgi:hypothetical protein